MKVTVEFARLAMAGALFVTLASSCSSSEHKVHVTVVGGAFGGVTSATPEWSCNDDCSLSVAADSMVELHPIPSATGTFQGWSGDCSGTDVCKLKAVKDVEITATFAAKTYPLHIDIIGPGHGTIRLPDGTGCTDSCDVSTTAGQPVHLVEETDEDSYFRGWTGAYYGVTAAADFDAREGQSISAHFASKVRLEITGIDASTKGMVASMPLGIFCGERCVGWFMPGEKVVLTPSTLDGMWSFRGWSGVDCPPATCEITMEGDKTIGARFSSIHLWSRVMKHANSWKFTSSANGNVTMALVSGFAQDFGAGPVKPYPGMFALFVTRFNSQGVPLFTKVFNSSADLGVTFMRELPDGGVSILVGVRHPGATANNTSADFGDYQAVVAPGESMQVHLELNATGDVTDAGASTAALGLATTIQSGSTLFMLAPNGDAVEALKNDWTPEWTLHVDPLQYIRLAPGPAGAAWALSASVPAEMNCAGGPVAGGALLQIDATGSCTVAWAYPDGFHASPALNAPGGAPLVEGGYVKSFEFGGSRLPEPPAGLGSHVRLRFDGTGTPKWGRTVLVGGGNSGASVYDAARLNDGRLLLMGSYSGISEFSPDVPSPYEPFLATYSDETGEMIWSASFTTTSTPTRGSFMSLFPFPDGRIGVLGWLQSGEFDLGDERIYASGQTLFLAGFDF